MQFTLGSAQAISLKQYLKIFYICRSKSFHLPKPSIYQLKAPKQHSSAIIQDNVQHYIRSASRLIEPSQVDLKSAGPLRLRGPVSNIARSAATARLHQLSSSRDHECTPANKQVSKDSQERIDCLSTPSTTKILAFPPMNAIYTCKW